MSRATALACLLLLLTPCSRSRKSAEPAAESAALVAPPAPSNPRDAGPSASASASASPPTSREHCLAPPIVPDVTLVPRLAELERASCDGNPRLQVLSRPGPKQPSLAELDQLNLQLTPVLQKELGVEYVVAQSCCDTQAKKELCLWVRLPLCAQPLERVAQVFAEALKATPVPDTKVSLLVEYRGQLGPRCAPGDASCKPLPYSSPDDKAAGPFTPPYDPALGRDPVDVSKEQLSSGACAHDGDCMRFGCGNHCMPWHTPEFGANCPAFIYLEDAHCGCVTGQCAWFTQVPEAQFRVTPGTPRVSGAGLSLERWQRSSALGVIARRFRTCYEKHLERLPLDLTLRFQVDGAGRLHSVNVETPDPARAACLVRAVKPVTVPKSALPPGARQDVSWPLTLHLAKREPSP